MTEDLIHFVWTSRLFDFNSLSTVHGERLRVVNTGLLNLDAGPDYSNAKISINEMLWVGNVELHVRATDWKRHHHHLDKAYNSVVLHVVYENDGIVTREDGTIMATLELKDRIPVNILNSYHDLMGNLHSVPCKERLGIMQPVHVHAQLGRALASRLEEKSEAIFTLLQELHGSWEEVFYILMARNFGFKVNALPFEMLARSLPQRILGHYKNNRIQIEALLFGQAGFLEAEVADGYIKILHDEYRFLAKKHALSCIEPHLWKYLRLHPQNFPSLRLAQFSGLVCQYSQLFSKILECETYSDFRKLLKSIRVSPYWETHYRIGKESDEVKYLLGDSSVDNILLNAVAQTLFAYGIYTGNDTLGQRAINLLESLRPETNNVIRYYESIGLVANTAADTQGILQLKKEWCDKKNCLLCSIGVKILNVQ